MWGTQSECRISLGVNNMLQDPCTPVTFDTLRSFLMFYKRLWKYIWDKLKSTVLWVRDNSKLDRIVLNLSDFSLGGKLPMKRAVKKRQQLENMYHHIRRCILHQNKSKHGGYYCQNCFGSWVFHALNISDSLFSSEIIQEHPIHWSTAIKLMFRFLGIIAYGK